MNLKNIQIFVFQGWLQLFLGLITRSAVDYTPEFIWRHQVWLHKPCDYIYNRRTHARLLICLNKFIILYNIFIQFILMQFYQESWFLLIYTIDIRNSKSLLKLLNYCMGYNFYFYFLILQQWVLHRWLFSRLSLSDYSVVVL